MQKALARLKTAFALAVVLSMTLVVAVPWLRVAFESAVQAQESGPANATAVRWSPAPAGYEPAVVQVFSARVLRWRGYFADHTWIAAKPTGATSYTRYEVIGWRLRRTGTALVESTTFTPDSPWYGAPPKLLQDIRGPEAEKVIAQLPAAVASYPYANTYRVWPGPNSNTFMAHIAREIPDLRLTLPGKAIGKDFTGWKVVERAPSGTGFQISIGGLFGFLLARDEGAEVNFLGLVIGADPLDLSITVPGIGRIPPQTDWTGG